MKKILVIDDDFQQRDLYAELFRQKGFDVSIAADGLQGLEIALKDKPDLVFTGIIMPRMDGFELIHNLRNNALTVLTPVIMFSHLGRAEDKEKAGELQDVYFMVKGYDDPKDIMAKVEELLGTASKAKSKPVIPDDDRAGRSVI
jgi:DNA-binding response OmpR family regulator